MDDPMTRSRLGRVTGTRPIGAPDPKWGPLLFSVLFCFAAVVDLCSLCRVSVPIVCGAAPLKSVIYVLQQYFGVPIVC